MNLLPKSDSPSWYVPVGLIVGVIVLWVLSGVFLYSREDRGTFGDMFGAINALFSGLAFAGVVYAILLQRRELELQRKELALTREELKGQTSAMSAQNETLRQQNFESTFFQLLRLHGDIVNAMDITNPMDRSTAIKGRDCFQVFYKRLKAKYGENRAEHQGGNERQRINKTYLSFYSGHQADIGHYFRSLYNIVKFVDRGNVVDKRLYTNLVRAQLSSFELALVFYNCLSDMGCDKFKPLIEKYALLKTVPFDHLLNPAEHVALYEVTAYEK